MEINITITVDDRVSELVGNVVAALQGTTVNVSNDLKAPAAPTRRRRTKKGDDKANGAKAPKGGDTGDVKADAKPKHTVEEVRNTLRKFATDNSPEKAREILETFEIDSVTTLFKDCPERVNDFMDAVTG